MATAADVKVKFEQEGAESVKSAVEGVGDAVSEANEKSEGFGTGAVLGALELHDALSELFDKTKELTEGLIDAGEEGDTYERQLTTLTHSASEASEILEQIKQRATSDPFSYQDLVAAAEAIEARGEDALSFLPTLEDAASATGKSLGDTTDAFLQAQMGMFRGLHDFGIDAETQGDQIVFSFERNGKAMTVTADNTAEGISTALMSIFQGNYAGATDEMAQSIEGRLTRLKNYVHFEMEDFGKPIADALGDAAGVADDWFRRLTSLEEAGLSPLQAALKATEMGIDDVFGPKIGAQIDGVLEGITGGVQSLVDVAEDATNVLGNLADGAISFLGDHAAATTGALAGMAIAFAGLLAYATLPAVFAPLIGVLTALVGPIGLVLAASAALGAAYETNFLGFATAVNTVAHTIHTVASALIGDFRTLIASGLNPVAAAFALVDTGLAIVAQHAGPFRDVLNDLVDMFSHFTAAATDFGDAIADLFRGDLATALDDARDGIIDVLGGIVSYMLAGLDLIRDGFNALIGLDWSGIWSWASDALSGIDWAGIASAIGHTVADTISAIDGSGIWGWLGDELQSAFDGISAAVTDGLQLAWDAITSLTWGDFISVLDWAEYVVKQTWAGLVDILHWAEFVLPLLWDQFVPKLTWSDFVTALDWYAILTKVAWDEFIKAIDWASYVKDLVWSDFIAQFTWSNFISALDWYSIVTKVAWDDYLSKLTWSDFITPLSWVGYVAALVWDFFVTVLEWPAFVTSLIWDAFVSVLDWGAHIVALAWSTFVPKLTWSDVLDQLTWSNFVSAVKWGTYISSLAWSAFITAITWPSYISDLAWSAFVTVLDWGGYLVKLSWDHFVGSVNWKSWIPDFGSWTSYIPNPFADVHIPSFPGWSAFFDAINPFSGGSGSSSDSSSNTPRGSGYGGTDGTGPGGNNGGGDSQRNTGGGLGRTSDVGVTFSDLDKASAAHSTTVTTTFKQVGGEAVAAMAAIVHAAIAAVPTSWSTAIRQTGAEAVAASSAIAHAAIAAVPTSWHTAISQAGAEGVSAAAAVEHAAIAAIPTSWHTTITQAGAEGAASEAYALRNAINSVPTSHNTTFTAYDAGVEAVASSVQAAINAVQDVKTVTIQVVQSGTVTAYAAGGDVRGPLSRLADGGGPELVQTPSGSWFLAASDGIYPTPPGSHVYTAGQTKSMIGDLQPVPAYATGSGHTVVAPVVESDRRPVINLFNLDMELLRHLPDIVTGAKALANVDELRALLGGV